MMHTHEIRRSSRWVASLTWSLVTFVWGSALAVAPGCLFDPTTAKGLSCLEAEDCGSELTCIRGLCQEEGWNPLATTRPELQLPECIPFGQPCSNGECCNGNCVDFGDGFSVCAPGCGSGAECESCCCRALANSEGSFIGGACGYPDICEMGLACESCGATGSMCISDADCCDGGRCFQTVGGFDRCFAPCTTSFDCEPGETCMPAPGGNICSG